MTNKIRKLFVNSLHFKKGSQKPAIYPNRDWAVIFFFFLALNLALVAFLVLFYLETGQDGNAADLNEEKTLMFEKTLFNERISQYQEKAEKLNVLLSESPQIVDPSI